MIESEIYEKLQQFGRETIQQLHINMKTQQVWPREVYPRYSEINEIRKKYGSWYSTGAGIESFIYEIRNARLDSARIDFFFNEYLRFADLGVGAGRPAEEVDRSKKARYKKRYTPWKLKGGHTHRPSLMMEFRHLQRRMGMYAMEKYGYQGQAYIMEGFAELLREL